MRASPNDQRAFDFARAGDVRREIAMGTVNLARLRELSLQFHFRDGLINMLDGLVTSGDVTQAAADEALLAFDCAKTPRQIPKPLHRQNQINAALCREKDGDC